MNLSCVPALHGEGLTSGCHGQFYDHRGKWEALGKSIPVVACVFLGGLYGLEEPICIWKVNEKGRGGECKQAWSFGGMSIKWRQVCVLISLS